MRNPLTGAQRQHEPTEGGDLPSVRHLSSTRPLARLEHSCSVCGFPIAIGTRYERILLRDTDALNQKKSLRVIKWHLPHCPEASQ